jgi:hypothetical protein
MHRASFWPRRTLLFVRKESLIVMKKGNFTLSLLLVGALLLAACAPNAGIPLDQPGVQETPMAETPFVNETPLVEDTLEIETPLVDDTPEVVPEETPVVVDDLTATPDAALETPVPAEVTDTEDLITREDVQFIRLSQIFTMTVATRDLNDIGLVRGLMLDQPFLVGQEGVPGVGATQPQGPYVKYALVEAINQGDAAQTTQDFAGEQFLVPWQAFTFDNQVLGPVTDLPLTNRLVLNVGHETFTGAPRYMVSPAGEGQAPGWEGELAQYWDAQGLSIPATGAEGTAQDRDYIHFESETIDSLTLMGANNEVIASVSDFMVDVRSGELVYAILTGGDALGGRSVVAPMRLLDLQETAAATLGGFTTNLQGIDLSTAPDLDQFDLDTLETSTWIEEINRYWESFQGMETNQ